MQLNRMRTLFITFVATTAFLAGCGSDSTNNAQSSSESSAQSSSSTAFTPPADNSNEPQNAYGYYGENVKFGELQLVGEWEYNDENSTDPIIYRFRSDGTDVLTSGIQFHNEYYGVDTNGSLLQVYWLHHSFAYSFEIQKQLSEKCFEANLIVLNDDNITTTKTGTLCRKETNTDALISGINVGKTFGAYGYYGNDVVLGDHNLTGTWKEYRDISSPYLGRIYHLESNGSAIIHYNSGNGQADSLANYGTNEDGTIFYFQYPPLQIESKYNDSCYVTVYDGDDNQFLLCKESNETQQTEI